MSQATPAPDLDLEVLAAEVADFVGNAPAAELIGAKLSRLLHAFLQGDLLPQVQRAAGLGLDPARCSPASPTCCGSTPTRWSGREYRPHRVMTPSWTSPTLGVPAGVV